jgi:integrase
MSTVDSPVSEEAMSRFEKRVVGRSIGQDTFEAYRLWIERFEMWFDGDEPSLRDLEDFDTLLEGGSGGSFPWSNDTGRPTPPSYSHSSRNQAICAVKMWVRRHYDVNIPEQPGDIIRGDPEPFKPTYLSRERVRGVIEGAGGDCECDGCAAALALSYDAVLRASELVRLSVADIDLGSGTLDVTATKNSRDSQIGVADSTLDRVRAYLEDAEHTSGALFRNTYGRKWTKNAWSTHVLRHHVEEGSHAFGRHTPILHQLEAGKPFGDVYRRARHKNPSTTAQYARKVGAEIPEWAAE